MKYKNIYWKNIKDSDVVTVTEKYFVVNGDHIANWSSFDSEKAQLYLLERAQGRVGSLSCVDIGYQQREAANERR